MAQGTGQLRTLRQRLCPTWAALGAVVLLAFLALGSIHDHGDDAPGTTAIHCPVVAGPVMESGTSGDLRLEVGDTVTLASATPRTGPASRRPLRSDGARAPPPRAA